MQISDFLQQQSDHTWQLPGIANLHSHAFQRAMAGLAERQTHPQDSFWTWRETMYALAQRFDPESLYAVAAQLYVEMLEAGYTSVCEFHYLHHQSGGQRYDTETAMSEALIQAAADTGIRLTLLPVLYMTGGFDGRNLSDRQLRFGNTVESYLRMLSHLHTKSHQALTIGCALHSLRAVPGEAMQEVLSALPQEMRIHIHIAEQVAEVNDCHEWRGARPVQWLYANAEVDQRWTLVHATHLSEDELTSIARSKATVALCPTTEANLGDGIFPLREFQRLNGVFGIGSDSHISVSPVEELRWLEYGQRLLHQQRNIAATDAMQSTGEALLQAVDASRQPSTGFDHFNDMVLLNRDSPLLLGANRNNIIDHWLFSGNRNAVSDVYVDDTHLVKEGRHHHRDAIAMQFKNTMKTLLDGL